MGTRVHVFAFSVSILMVGIALAEQPRSGDRGLSPLPVKEWDYDTARHLLSRAGFGGSPQTIEKIHAMGLHDAVEYLVDFQQLPVQEFSIDVQRLQPPRIQRRELAKLSIDERKRIEEDRRKKSAVLRKQDREQLAQIRQWWVQRMVQSPRPLEEKLVLFWHGHFATGHRTVKSSYAMYQQNQLFRQHAGDFGQLLKEIIRDPAMLRYLDNDRNVKAHPNENLAREVLELFSMGEGNYSEQDIKEAARALTGYSFNRQSLESTFRKSVHDHGQKTVFGQTGNWDGDELVELILQQPITAKFVAKKLFVFFAHDHPDEQTITELADVLRDANYQIRPLLKKLFLSEQFYGLHSMGNQIKSPVQLSVGLYKNLGIKKTNYKALVNVCQTMGQALLEPPNVKGWDGGRAWINTNSVFLRNNSVASLINSRGPKNQMRRKNGVRNRGIDLVAVLDSQDFESSSDVVDYLVDACLMVPPSQSSKRLLVEFLDTGRPLPPANQWAEQRERVNAKLRALLILITGLPEFQLT